MILLLTVIAHAQESSEEARELDGADQPLVTRAVVGAPIAEVWKAWTTTEGIKSWMVAEGDFDLKIGGKMRTAYRPRTDLDGPNAIESTILAFDPERMLAIRVTKAPDGFPFKNAILEVWTVIYFRPIDEERTEVVVRMLGYNSEKESVQMRNFFVRGNEQTLDALVKHFGTP